MTSKKNYSLFFPCLSTIILCVSQNLESVCRPPTRRPPAFRTACKCCSPRCKSVMTRYTAPMFEHNFGGTQLHVFGAMKCYLWDCRLRLNGCTVGNWPSTPCSAASNIAFNICSHKCLSLYRAGQKNLLQIFSGQAAMVYIPQGLAVTNVHNK